jgi:hypothetical protein
MHFDGSVNRLGHASHRARKFAEVTVAVAGLNRLHRSAQRGLILDRLRHQPQLRSERCHLRTRGALSGQHAHGCVFGVC